MTGKHPRNRAQLTSLAPSNSTSESWSDSNFSLIELNPAGRTQSLFEVVASLFRELNTVLGIWRRGLIMRRQLVSIQDNWNKDRHWLQESLIRLEFRMERDLKKFRTVSDEVVAEEKFLRTLSLPAAHAFAPCQLRSTFYS